MAFKVGSTSVFPGIYTAPDANSTGGNLFSNGTTTYWSYPGETNTNIGSGFRYRSIFTHGFLAAGYKNSNAWRAVNKTWHATDTTYFCGEQLDRAGAYIDGTYSDYNGYIMGMPKDMSYSGSSVHTSSINLMTGSARARGYNNFGSGTAPSFGYIGDNPTAQGVTYGTGYTTEGTASPGVGGWDMSVARHIHGSFTDQVNQVGYIIGGGSAVTEKLHFPTEVMYTTTSSTSASAATTGAYGQNTGYGVFAGTGYQMSFSTNAWTSWTSPGSDGYRKGLMTKYGHFYMGTGGNVTLGWAKINDSTGASITTFNGLSSVGEENLQMGQDWGYMLGNYNNQQNNMTWKFTYSNDAIIALGLTAQPKGHNGQSSGVCFSAAASIVSTRYTY
jgi:hypothetical protein